MSNRKGATIITSVSLSKEFNDIIKKFNISPTNAIRKGIAVELYELGIPKYATELNKGRAEALKRIFATDEYGVLLQDVEKLTKSLKNFKILMEVKK